MDLPAGNIKDNKGVPEDWLPMLKMQYHFMCRKVDPLVIKVAAEAMRPKHFKLSQKSFNKYLDGLKEKAILNTDKKFLLILLGTSHGYQKYG